MTKCQEIITFIERIAPRELAEEWDNIGLMVGSRDTEVHQIMLCMDITGVTLEEAVKNKADLIVTHHPVIFKGLKSLTEDGAKGRLLHQLIRNHINVYSAHTNLDFAVTGVNTCLAEVLGVKESTVFGKGPGRVGHLEHKIDLQDFIQQVKSILNDPFVRVVGKAEQGVQRVAVFSGSFDDDLEAVLQCGADVVVTGDLKYHTALDAVEAGLCIVDAGHFNTERVVLPALAAELVKAFPDIEVFCSQQETDPFHTY